MKHTPSHELVCHALKINQDSFSTFLFGSRAAQPIAQDKVKENHETEKTDNLQERQADRQRDRQTNRQRDRQTDNQKQAVMT